LDFNLSWFTLNCTTHRRLDPVLSSKAMTASTSLAFGSRHGFACSTQQCSRITTFLGTSSSPHRCPCRSFSRIFRLFLFQHLEPLRLEICKIEDLKIRLRHSISAVNLFFTYIFRESFLFRWTVHSLDSKVFIFADIFIAPSCPVSRHKTENRHTIIHSKEIDTPNLLKGMGFLMACQAIFHGAMVIRFIRRLIPSGWN